jgi:hypothetical protein
MIARPGSPTANASILRDAQTPGTPMIDLARIWRGRIVVATDFTDADQSQALNLRTMFAATNPIPDDIDVWSPKVDLVEVVAGGGITTATIILGETTPVNDTDGYLTSTNVFTGATLGWKDTPAAALYGPRYRPEFTPLLQLDVGVGTVAGATSGIFDVTFKYSLTPSHRAA